MPFLGTGHVWLLVILLAVLVILFAGLVLLVRGILRLVLPQDTKPASAGVRPPPPPPPL